MHDADPGVIPCSGAQMITMNHDDHHKVPDFDGMAIS